MSTRAIKDGSAVVATFTPLRDNAAGRLDVRVVVFRGQRRLDIRQFLETDNFQGHTRRGISLTAEEFKALLVQRDEIEAAFNGDRRAPAETAT